MLGAAGEASERVELRQKWDRVLVKLLTGNSLDLRKSKSGGSLASDLWDELGQARQDAANRLLAEAKSSSAKGDPPPAKKPRQVKAGHSPSRSHQCYGAGPQQCHAAGRACGQKLWVEATADNLHWLHSALEAAQPKEKKSRKDNNPGPSQRRKASLSVKNDSTKKARVRIIEDGAQRLSC